tara:strand:- start:2352 stop:2684 length:333 start_codon:yes stop_codon:yes gene_type:complete
MIKNSFQGPFFHVVFFWLKNSKNEKDRLKLEIELKNFIQANNQVRSSHIGAPANTKRTVVDNSYDLSLIVTFNSKEEQEIYQNDPTHIEFIDRASELWDRVQVYDSFQVD